MVVRALQMLVIQPLDFFTIEHRQFVGGPVDDQYIVKQIVQIVSDPVRDGDSKSLLFSRDDLSRNDRSIAAISQECLLEQVFRLTPMQLQ